MASLARSGGEQVDYPVERLDANEAMRLALTKPSRFTNLQLSVHVAEYPDLGLRVAGTNEYAVGGLWRRRSEIGIVVEVSDRKHGDHLIGALVRAFRQRSCAVVVVDPFEQERNHVLYERHRFEPVETLIQLERHGHQSTAKAPHVPIRAMCESDIGALLEVERHSFPFLWWNSEAELLWYAAIPAVKLYVACAMEQTEQVVGYAGLTILGREAHLDRLAVRTDHQGRGYGTALLAYALERMKDAGASRVALTTQMNNWRSQLLYKRFGFRASGWMQEIFGLWLTDHTP